MSACYRCGNDHDKGSSEWDLFGHLCAYRADRPDEWTMDDFMRLAKKERNQLQSANAEVARLTKALEGIRDCRFTWEMASNVDTLQDIARSTLAKGE